MFELGDFSEAIHTELGKKSDQWGLDLFIGVGPMMALASRAVNDGVASEHFATATEAGLYLKEILQPGDVVLLKGSRAMKMEAALMEVLNNAL
jgi:UDP-N-acetylmuramoyl-tripeptide--D-alanyl-D-alanine ligase